MKRINNYEIKELIEDKDKLKIDIDFDLIHKQYCRLLDRTLTQDKINIQYNSDIDEIPRISIKTLKGQTINGFNLKRKHLDEIKELLDNSNNESLKKLKDKL